MKLNKPIVLASIAAIALIFSLGSCNQQNMPDDQSDSPLNIRVVDQGYHSDSAPAQPGLGSQDNDDYTTQFTDGDAIGVYAVKGGPIVDNIENLKLTATTKDGQTVWQNTDGKFVSLKAGTSYYAYYPYQAAPAAQPTFSATDAAGFFKPLIDAWIPATDQSTQAQYTASDLMVSQGVITDKTLSFTMSHQMTLAVLKFQSTARYVFSNTDPVIDSYSVTASPMPVFDNGVAPWHSTDYIFRYLINPKAKQKPASLTGGYQGAIAKWSCTMMDDMAPGSYYTYPIGAPDGKVEVIYDLEPGDFLLKDGILLPKGTTLDDVYKAAVRAVVMKAGRDPGDDPKVDKYKSKDGTTDNMTVHGYAVALFDSNADSQQKGQRCQWSRSTNKIGIGTSTTDFMGYSNTQTIKDYAKKNGKELKTSYPACYWTTEGYENSSSKNPGDHAAPGNSSGWFFPSCGQLKYLYDKRTTYLSSITQAGGQAWQTDRYYWSSSEDSRNPTSGVSYVNFANGSVSIIGKQGILYVRALVAF